jgi:hypothetical protein
VGFSPLGGRVAAGGNGGELLIWDAVSGKELCRSKSGAMVHSLTFSPDGKYILTGDYNHTLSLHDALTGEQQFVLRDHADMVLGVAIQEKGGRLYALSGGGGERSPTGGGFLPGKRDHVVRLWDLQQRQVVQRFSGHSNWVMCVAFSPNRRHAVSSSLDNTVRVWDRETGQELRCFRGHTEGVRAVAVSPDGRYAVSGGDDCQLRIWELPLGVQDLARALESKNVRDLARAIRDADTMGSELYKLAPAMLAALKGSSAEQRRLLFHALQYAGAVGVDHVPALASLMKDQEPELRLFAFKSLATLGPTARSVLPGLKEAFSDTNDSTQLLAIMGALSRVGAGEDRSLIEPLTTKGLRHADASVRLIHVPVDVFWSAGRG